MRMLLLVIGLVLAFLTPCVAMGQPPIPEARIGRDADVWAARSCVGEAGWLAWRGECSGILEVYRSRWEIMSQTRPKLSYADVVRRYSSAVKRHPGHDRPWLFTIETVLRRPRGWQRTSSWEVRRIDWAYTLGTVRRWLWGEVETSCPGAGHYGNRTTDGRPTGHVLHECSAETRNRFWRRP